MSKYVLPIAFCFSALTCLIANAQNLCPAGVASDKLVCLIPQVYGVNGLIAVANPNAPGNFKAAFLSTSLGPLTSAIARQAALLPLASPSSGIIFSWSPAAKIQVASTDSFGPIMGERAETIGKYRVFLGFDYQYFKFDSLDGLNLRHLPVVFTQGDFTLNTGQTCSISPPDTSANEGACGFIRDVVKTDNSIDLKIHQYTTFVTFGLTNRIDLSMAIPIENIRMAIFSNATVVPNSQSPFHAFPTRPQDNCGSDTPPVQPCLNQLFSSIRSVSGIADITLRLKAKAWQGKDEQAGLALGVDIRMPTGDSLNFLGAGAVGVKPFVVFSYRLPRYRLWPHASVGYEANGSSKIAGDVSTGTREKLPSQLTYSGGADAWLTKWFTAVFDVVGQQVFDAQRTNIADFTELGACIDTSCLPSSGFKTPNQDQNLSLSRGTFNITNASFGVKFRPVGNLLITGNVLIKLNDGGLRADVVPLGGVSYTF